LAITLLPRNLPSKLLAKQLIVLPPILLAPASSNITSVEELLRRPSTKQEALICLPPDEMICREFQAWLQTNGVEWRPRIEVGSLNLVEHYVQEGYGIGLSFRIPGIRIPPNLRALPLPQHLDIPFGIIWRDNPDKLLRAFRIEAERRADQMKRASSNPTDS
jgi:DNA-binding transcriptional LysR family regulator